MNGIAPGSLYESISQLSGFRIQNTSVANASGWGIALCGSDIVIDGSHGVDFTNAVNGVRLSSRWAAGIDNVISDLDLSSVGGTAIQLGGDYNTFRNVSIVNVNMTGPGNYGISVTGTRGTIDGLTIDNVHAVGRTYGLYAGGKYSGSYSNILVRNSHFDGTDRTGYGVYLHSAHDAPHGIQNVTLENVSAKNREAGLLLAGLNATNVTVRDSDFSNCVNGIYMSNASNNSIIGNQIHDSDYAIRLCRVGADVTENDLSDNQYGLHLEDSNGSVVYHNNIYNNSVYNVWSNQPIELSAEIDGIGEGNFWGHNDPPCFYVFGEHRTPYDGNRADVIDSYPFCSYNGWKNNPPTASAGGPYSVDEGSYCLVTADGSDPDGDALTFAWDLDNDGAFETPGQSATFSAGELGGPSTHTIVVQVMDTGGLWATDQTTVEVLNIAPTVGEITAPVDPVEVNTAISVSANFSDPGTSDTHTAICDWGDDNTSEGIVDETGGSGSVSGNYIYTTAGVYTVKLTVTDDDGGSSQSIFQFVVVYNPEGGFVTGGGWIDSPEGAYAPDPSLTGKANFGFVSKYKKGATVPTGQTEFNFKVASMNFHSSSYEWLVVANHKAKYKGVGTINDAGNYGFMLSAIDEELTPSTDVDLFRIKIWDKDNNDSIVYDNQMDAEDDADPTTAIGGGNIKIHGDGNASPVHPDLTFRSANVPLDIPKVFRLLQNYPNPFNPETWLPYQLAAETMVLIRIYNANGQLVRQLDLGHQQAGSYLDRDEAAYWDGKDETGQPVSSGVYFYQIKAGDFSAVRKMTIVK